MVGLFRFYRGFTTVQVWHQSLVPGQCQTVGDTTDLVIEPPPLLNDNYGRSAGGDHRFCQIALYCLAVWARKDDGLSHGFLL